MSGQQVQHTGIGDQRVVEAGIGPVAGPAAAAQVPLGAGHQSVGLAILLHQGQAGGEIGGREVRLPGITMHLLQALAQGGDQISGHLPLSRQQIDGKGPLAQPGKAGVALVGRHPLQVAGRAPEQVVRNRQATFACLDQVQHGVGGNPGLGLHGGPPVADRPLAVLTGGEQAEQIGEGIGMALGRCAGTTWASRDGRVFGPALEHQGRHRPTEHLLGALMLEAGEIATEAIGNHQGRMGDRRRVLGKRGEQGAQRGDLALLAVEPAERGLGVIGGRRPHREFGLDRSRVVLGRRPEAQAGRSRLTAGTQSEAQHPFLLRRQTQFTLTGFDGTQALGQIETQCDRQNPLAQPIDGVGNADADIELIARCDHGRNIR